jgi:hypothetical protein
MARERIENAAKLRFKIAFALKRRAMQVDWRSA